MSGASVALDTNVAIGVLAGEATALVEQNPAGFFLPVPVVGEL